jgi:photosystem II stability/assembly factor-like uncharacterized protein
LARDILQKGSLVFLRSSTPWRRCGLGAALVGLTLLASPLPSFAQQASNDQQIQEIQKQIEALTRKLEQLRVGKPALSDGTLPAEWVKALNWRSIGPAGMGGRITAISVFEADPTTYWIATASGGLLKTVNNGVTFEHQFDKEATVSIGDVCVAPSDKNIVWVGTGEGNPRNSVSYGDGVYKSTDGGKKWKHMGLKKSFQIGRLAIHPKDPNIVYVGALGRLYGPNEERGLYKSTNGGETWERILYVDDKTGIIDLVMHPNDPDTLLVATWERQRDGFDSHRGEPPPAEGYDPYDPVKKWGPGGGIYKTTNGGKTFKKLTAGLPTCSLGRIGLDYYRKNPNVVFAVIDCEKIGMGNPPSRAYLGIQGEDAEGGARLTQVSDNSPASKAGLKVGDIILAVDKTDVRNYEQLSQIFPGRKAGDKPTLKVKRGTETLTITATLEDRPPDPREQRQQAEAGVYIGVQGEAAANGVRLTQVAENSPAAKAGLKAGDVILAADKDKITAVPQLLTLTQNRKAGDKLTFQFLRDKETKDAVVTLENRPAAREVFAGPGSASRTRPNSFMYGGQQPNIQNRQGANGHEFGGVYKSTDGGETWTRVNSLNPRPMYFSVVRVDPTDDNVVWVLGISLYRSKDGGQTFSAHGNRGLHPDQHALWIHPRDGRHLIVGCDGGFYVSYDAAEHWDHLNHVAIAQFYHVCVDNRRPYHVYGGLQDNASWRGPSHMLNGAGPINEDWIFLSGGDGFVCRVDPNDPDVVYSESQDGNIGRRNLRTGGRASIRPRNVEGQAPYRFNWNTPFILSHHNPSLFYSAGNYVFRSLKRGDELRAISPEISRTKRGTGTALAESPRNPEVLWVGTDDGALWVTRDGGFQWTSVADKVGLPGPRWVATIEPSRFAEGRCYVVFDAHRSDDDEPYVYVTEDYGQTWKSLRANLPWGSTRVLREDVVNENLLFLGTEFGAWASLNRGQSWTQINNNLPTVAVHEFAIHPTAGEIVAGTHGRSLWVLDLTPLRQMTAEVLKAKAHLFRPNPAVQWRSQPSRGSPYGNGSRKFFGQNPAPGAQIYYFLADKADKVTLKVVDYAGETVRELQATTQPGLNRAAWTLTRPGQRPGGPGGGRGGQGGGGRGGQGPPEAAAQRAEMAQRFGGFMFGQPVTPGMYRVVLTVDGKEFTQPLRVEADPTVPAPIIASDQDGEPLNSSF